MKLTKEQELAIKLCELDIESIDRQIAILTGKPLPKPAPIPAPKIPEKKTTTKTFAELRKDCIKWNSKRETAAKERDETIAYYKKIGYGAQVLQAKISEANAEYDEIMIDGKDELIAAAEELRTAKLEQLTASIQKAPSEEHTAKLNELRYRKDLNQHELKAVADSMADDYGSLRLLRDIADDHGYILLVPDFMVIGQRINDACDHAVKMLNVDNIDDNYNAFGFFGDFERAPFWTQAVQGLDDDKFSVVPEIEQRVLKDNETALLDRLFGSVRSLDLAEEVNKAAQSKEMRTLIELHPEYSALLEPSKESANNG